MKKKYKIYSQALFIILLGSVLLGNTSVDNGSTTKVDGIIDIFKNKAKYPDYTLVAAHRGYWREYPENTIPAYEAAIEIGADIVEMDIRLTKDSVLVVSHDGCLPRVTTGKGSLIDHTWEQVHQLDLKTHDGKLTTLKILRLEEALNYLKGKALLSLDIKEVGKLFDYTFTEAISTAKKLGILNQLIIKGKKRKADLDVLLASANVAITDFMYTPVIFGPKNNDASRANFNASIAEIWKWAEQGEINSVELVYKRDSDPMLDQLAKANSLNLWIGQYSFWPEECGGVHAEDNKARPCQMVLRDYVFKNENGDDFLDDGRGDWDWLISKETDYIITDRPSLMITYLTKINKRSLTKKS